MSLIVLACDQPQNRNVFLQWAPAIERDIEVRSFSDPQAALDWLDEHRADLIISDLQGPAMDGVAFIHALRSCRTGSEQPILMVAPSEQASERLSALEAGATDFLTHPPDQAEFLSRTRNLLKLRRLAPSRAERDNFRECETSSDHDALLPSARKSTTRLAEMIDEAPILLSAVDASGLILFANQALAAFYGLDRREIEGREASAVFAHDQTARGLALNRMIFDLEDSLPPFEEELVDQTGLKRIFVSTKSPLKNKHGKTYAVLTSSIDITERKGAENQLRRLVHHDALTGLPNEAYLRNWMRRRITGARRGDHSFALHVLNLDRFNLVSRVLGRVAGDCIIRRIGDQLRAQMRGSDVLARIGGDVFALIQSDVACAEDAASFSRRALAAVVETDCSDWMDEPVTGSLGIAIHPMDGVEPAELLNHADLAMVHAKAAGGNHYCFYNANMTERARSAVALKRNLQRGIEKNQFVLLYQPIVDLESGAISGAEALLRWRKPDSSLVLPDAFLSLTEDAGLAAELNEWVLREACRAAKSWQTLDASALQVSVNLSVSHFKKKSIPLLIAQVLAETGLDPRRLDIELPEAALMSDLEVVRPDLNHIRSLGVRITIDDFGSGYSSLAYLKRLPADRIKIDQNLIGNMSGDPNDFAMVRSLIALSRSFHLPVVAKGVEAAEQAAKLQSVQCDLGQGFFFARPMSSEDFSAFLEVRSASARFARRSV